MNYNVVLLELLTTLLGIGLLVATLLIPRKFKKAVGYISVLGLIGILAVSFLSFSDKPAYFTNSFFILDNLAVYFKQIFIVAAILVTIMSLSFTDRLHENHSEFFMLMVFALVGMMSMASANDFISLYIGLELMTIAFVILTAFDKGNIKSYEAGLKYIFLSAASTAVLLYGMSIMYGISGSLVFPDIMEALKGTSSSPALLIAIVMVIVGFAFKISAVPFHMWAPDIYEGAPTPITAFLAIGSKAAGFAVLVRLLFQVMPSASSIFITLIIALAVLTIIVGNLIAIPQANIKRLLAYSSIAHAGYMLVGFVAYTQSGIGAILYYILAYVFANAGVFASIIAISSGTGSYEIKDFKGMWKKSPFASAILTISLLSLAGIPPAAGFTGKFFLFVSVMKEGYMWMALLAMGMSVVSVYYYIKVIRTMLMENPADDKVIKVPVSLKLVMAVTTVFTIVMGVYPTPFIEWAGNIASTIIK